MLVHPLAQLIGATHDGCQFARGLDESQASKPLLDIGGLASSRRLALKGTDLPTKFAKKIGEALKLRIERAKLAQRAVLAAAVLGDSGRLLDHRAPILGTTVHHHIELPLPKQCVQFAPNPGVTQHLADVKQPTRTTV